MFPSFVYKFPTGPVGLVLYSQFHLVFLSMSSYAFPVLELVSVLLFHELLAAQFTHARSRTNCDFARAERGGPAIAQDSLKLIELEEPAYADQFEALSCHLDRCGFRSVQRTQRGRVRLLEVTDLP